MRGEQIVVAVVVQHAHAGNVRTGGDDEIRWRETVVTDVGKLALRLQRNIFNFSIDLDAWQSRKVGHHRRALGARSCRVTGLEQKRQACRELLFAHPPGDRLGSISFQALGGEASPGRVVEQQHADCR